MTNGWRGEDGMGEVPAQGKHTWEEFAADQGNRDK